MKTSLYEHVFPHFAKPTNQLNEASVEDEVGRQKNRTKQYWALRFSPVIQAWNRNAATLNPNKIDRSQMETSSGISWEISSGVLEYVWKHMMTYDVLESNIKGKILSENPVPNNLK